MSKKRRIPVVRGYLLVISILGIVITSVNIVLGGEVMDVKNSAITPASIDAPSIIAGAGIIEAASHNIEVASHMAGVVESIYVVVGDTITKGSPLFSLDKRMLLSQRELKNSELKVAEAVYAKCETDFNLISPLLGRRVISKEVYLQRENELKIAAARVSEAEHQLGVVETDIERSTVNSPISGQVLQINIRPGERVSESYTNAGAMVVGDTSKLVVRVDFDENDAVRFKKELPAHMFLRGDSQKRTSLTFKEIEPYVIPKRSLTGGSTERIDTRVLQVLYIFDPEHFPIYVGQQVDVFLEATS